MASARSAGVSALSSVVTRGKRNINAPPKTEVGIGFLAFLGALSVGLAALMINIAISKPGRVEAVSDEPEVVVVDGHVGTGALIVNGEYRLLSRMENSRPVWAKYASMGRVQTSYLLHSQCGEWTISTHRTGRGSKCDGLVVARGCDVQGASSGPWNCTGHWQSTARSGTKANTLAVTPAMGPPSLSSCSQEEEQEAQDELSDVDLVLTWVNGSDPSWLSERASACEDFMWRRWPEAVKASPSVQSCLKEQEALDEATRFVEAGSCVPGAAGQPSACDGQHDVDRGLLTRGSMCFKRFLKEQCKSREHSIADHDELRYLVRSIERNLPWHKGRILIITPRGQFPRWLTARGRLKVLAQEDLFRVAMQAPEFVSASKRGVQASLPDGIYNDDPVIFALPFLPHISRLAIVLQDDLLFPRPVQACELFSRPPGVGMRLFGEASVPEQVADPWAHVHRAHISHSARFWEEQLSSEILVATARGGVAEGPSPFHEPQHAPAVVDTALLRELWRKWPKEFSAGMDSAFRHPQLLNPIGLHNSEAMRRSRAARMELDWRPYWIHTFRRKVSAAVALLRRQAEFKLPTSKSQPAPRPKRDFSSKELWARTRNVDTRDPAQLLVKEVVMHQGTGPEWRALMEDIIGGSVVPAVLSIHDNLVSLPTDEYICLREQWLNRLLRGASSWETWRQPPRSCRLESPPALGPDR